MKKLATICLLVAISSSAFANDADIFDEVDHHYVDNDGVKIHYVTAGEGPVVFFVHGVPEFWGTWYHQIAGLKDSYKCVALDTRGYNKSDAPEGQENYSVDFVMSDIKAVLSDVGADSFTLVGHDYGGFTDAHSVGNLDLMHYGVEQARRAWISKKDVLNTRTLNQLLKALER